MNLVFLGPPGSGKGTQANLLRDRFGFVLVGMGNILRDQIRRETPVGLKVKDIIERGLFPENKLVIALLEEHLSGLLPSPRLLFDGFPRDLFQAEALERILKDHGLAVDYAVYLRADENVLLERILNRLVCGGCGALYALPNNPPKVEWVCDTCGDRLAKRQDDQADVFKERFRLSQEKEKPMLDFYQGQGTLVEVDALEPMESVYQAIVKAIKL